MAVHPIIIPAPHDPSAIQQSTNVAAWTEQATEALRTVNLSAEAAQQVHRGTSATLSVPLDERHEPVAHATAGSRNIHCRGSRQVHTSYGRSEPMRRDSLRRRDALLKGKEGSRQRRRWENGTSLNKTMI
jgi:R3H-associated N-terminal domain